METETHNIPVPNNHHLIGLDHLLYENVCWLYIVIFAAFFSSL